jgi:SAM-dependent methyltransferase
LIKESYNLAKISYRLLRESKLERSTSKVKKEYETAWNVPAKNLPQAKTLEEWFYLLSDQGIPSLHNVSGRLRNQEFDTGYYRGLILEQIQKHFPQARSVTEFGCGVGENLLFLKSRMPQLECYGYELSATGVDTARKAAAKFGLQVQYAQLDYVYGAPSDYVFPVTDVAFTVLSLEQLPDQNLKAIQNIHSRVKMGSVHVEPVCENYPYNFRGIMGRVYISKRDYLRNFDQNARSLKLKKISKRLLLTAHNPLMFPSLYVLEK